MRRTPLFIFAAWLLLCVGYEGWRMAAFMAAPATGDLYAHAWGFQLVTFAMFRMWFWIAALLYAIGFEGLWYRRSHPVA